MKALNNRIFLKKDNAVLKKGNIHLIKKEGMYAPPYSGIIVEVGPSVKDKDYIKGVRVTFTDLSGIELCINGEDIFSIRENDITSIIPNNWSIE
jgi:co-chaperonin GroES (HSP10)